MNRDFSTLTREKCHGSSRPDPHETRISRVTRMVAGRVESGQEDFKLSRVESGRVKRFTKSRGSGRVRRFSKSRGSGRVRTRSAVVVRGAARGDVPASHPAWRGCSSRLHIYLMMARFESGWLTWFCEISQYRHDLIR